MVMFNIGRCVCADPLCVVAASLYLHRSHIVEDAVDRTEEKESVESGRGREQEVGTRLRQVEMIGVGRGD